MPNRRAGFTIVELLIVIVVIGILAAITIITFNGVQAKAQDARRKSDITAIAKLISNYQTLNNNQLLQYGTNCNQSYAGWFNQTGTSASGTTYGTNSMMDCLKLSGVTNSTITDPSGVTSCASSTGSPCYAYMVAQCLVNGQPVTYVYTHLQTESMDMSNGDTCGQGSGWATSFGMNYYKKVN